MVTRLSRKRTYRAIPSRYPAVGIFDRVARPEDLPILIALEAATNPRALDEAGQLALVRPEDRISGPETTAIMASFTHTGPSRFSPGTYGVYYAAFDVDTTIAETAYHRGRFLRDAGLPDERLDMRVYSADVSGAFHKLAYTAKNAPLYDPQSYAASQRFAAALQRANKVDGIVYRSVRRPKGTCVAVFRPRLVSHCAVFEHLEYRFANGELQAVARIELREPAQ